MRTLKIRFIFLIVLFNHAAFAGGPPDEGMWLPLLLKDYNYVEMERLGLKLTPEQIYSVNNASLKDAIVQLGGFCTAEVISNEGLLLTNHHCAYDAIATSSTEENNYLRDGFWAMNRGEEIPIEGLTVTFLVRMVDVSARIFDRISTVEEGEEFMAEAEEQQLIEQEFSENGRYRVDVKNMFNGNAYYAFVYETYSDIRLVGAPPSSVGKFGGDTDNWMWPRHTGDFSMLRIYASDDNAPASYSSSNKPFAPKHFLPVSTSGLSKGDFTMIMGYPASTDRYLTSFEVAETQNHEDPVYIDVLEKRLAIMKAEMDKSEATKIQYASDYASLANSAKYFRGQLRGLKKFDLISQKQAYEKRLTTWINADDTRKSKYSEVLKSIEQTIASDNTLSADNGYVNFAGFAPEFATRGIKLLRLKRSLESESTQSTIDEQAGEVLKLMNEAFESYNPTMDENLCVMALDYMKSSVSENMVMDLFASKFYLKKAKQSNERFASLVFSKSILTDKERMDKFLSKPSLKTLEKDPGMMYLNSLIRAYRSSLQPRLAARQGTLDEQKEIYFRLLQEKENAKKFYPDANFTMRLTYGTVQPYNSWEGKPFETFTYAEQILDKYKAGDEEFDVPEKLRTLIKNKDYGSYAGSNGKLNVCFLHNTDITGGNSGSPVINGKGELVGVAFDGNWESMTSDLFWQDEYVRTISVDVRYVLFIIDKYAGASHLIDEMKLVK